MARPERHGLNNNQNILEVKTVRSPDFDRHPPRPSQAYMLAPYMASCFQYASNGVCIELRCYEWCTTSSPFPLHIFGSKKLQS